MIICNSYCDSQKDNQRKQFKEVEQKLPKEESKQKAKNIFNPKVEKGTVTTTKTNEPNRKLISNGRFNIYILI